VSHLDYRATMGLLRNDTPSDPAHGWIGFSLPPPPGQTGQGAVVYLEAGGRTQVRLHQPASSYLSQGDPRLHFGLGRDTHAETVRVRLPGGRERTWRNLAAGRYWTLPADGGPARADR